MLAGERVTRAPFGTTNQSKRIAHELFNCLNLVFKPVGHVAKAHGTCTTELRNHGQFTGEVSPGA